MGDFPELLNQCNLLPGTYHKGLKSSCSLLLLLYLLPMNAFNSNCTCFANSVTDVYEVDF